MQFMAPSTPQTASMASPSPSRGAIDSLLHPLTVRLHLPRESAHTVASATHCVEERLNGNTSDSSSGASATKRGREDQEDVHKRKQRKPTYAVRKEERHVLLQEMRDLEAQVEQLRRQIGMPSIGEHATMQQSLDVNRQLRETRRNHAIALCGTHSILSQRLRDEFASPLKMYVRLGRDNAERKTSLLALRKEKLSMAYEFMQHRSVGLPAHTPLQHNEAWTSPAGDFCVIHNDITHFDSAKSVKQAYDALVFYMSNMEISISEELGHLTLREDINSVDTSSTHNRLISSTDHGVLIETNSVAFGEYYPQFEGADGHEFAILTNDSVDEDELYPYRPLERVRKNVSAAVSISWCQRPSTSNPGQLESVVVMRRSAFVSILKPQCPLSPEALEDLRVNLGSWGHVMTKVMRDHLLSSNE